jgi:hypothetical protein
VTTSASDGTHRFNNHPDFARAATTLIEVGATRSGIVSPAPPRRRPILPQVSKAYAFLQMMAGDFGRESHFAQAATASSASS